MTLMCSLFAKFFKQLFKLFRQFGGKGQHLSLAKGEGERRRMKELPPQLLEAPLCAAIDHITRHRMPDRGQMHAYLVHAARPRPDLKESGGGKLFEHGVLRNRLLRHADPAPRAKDAHLGGRRREATERARDRSAPLLEMSARQGEIHLNDGTGPEELLETQETLLIPRHDHHARGQLVEAVHDARAVEAYRFRFV